jgi:glutaredoxin
MAIVTIITSRKCTDCTKVKRLIQMASVLANEPVEFEEFDSTSDQAVEKALQFGMTNVPSFVIRGKVFNTANPPMQDVISALKPKKK